MREILFRGKRKDNGEWVEGFYVFDECALIVENLSYSLIDNKKCQLVGAHPVIIETVGQYTGLTDKNGTKIFEGNIVKAQDDIFGSPFCNGITGKIVCDETAFFIEPQNPMETQWLFNECAVYEVIGNIYDNPELLRGDHNE